MDRMYCLDRIHRAKVLLSETNNQEPLVGRLGHPDNLRMLMIID